MNRRRTVKAEIVRRLGTTADPVLTRDLHERTGNLAEVRGVFRPRLHIDPLLQVAPRYIKQFLLFHEGAHVVLKHGLWLVIYRIATLGLVDPWARAVMEQQADRWALEAMGPHAFANAVMRLYKPPKGRFARWVHNIVYGRSAAERCARVGVEFTLPGDSRAVPLEQVEAAAE